MHKKGRWFFKLSFSNIFLILIGILINFVGYWIGEIFSLPFWLDSVGTILTASLLGPLAGGIAGGIGGAICTIAASKTLLYALVNIIVGIIVGLLLPEDTADLFQVLCTAAIVAIVSIVVATPINLFVRHGYTGNIWGDALFDMLRQDGNGKVFCAVLGEALVDFPDKVISFFLATGLTKVWCRFNQNAREEGV